MRGFLRVLLDGNEVIEMEPNDLFSYEANRYFTLFVNGVEPGSGLGVTGDAFFRGSHTYNTATGKQPYISAPSTVGISGLSSSGQVMRYRYTGSRTQAAPASPNQIAFALGRVVCVSNSGSAILPIPLLSAVDTALGQVGNVFGHPVGRRAFFNETAISPTGTGVLTPTLSAPLQFANNEEGHYLFDIRIVASGTQSTATYFYRRRPFFQGCYEAGAGQSDSVVASGSDTLGTRLTGARNSVDISTLIANTSSPTPSTVPYNDNYPTVTAQSGSIASTTTGMCYDNTTGGRVWWCMTDTVAASSGNASASRSLWAWKRMCGEAPARMDSVITGFPTLPAGTQFRDLKASYQGGFIFLAVDGTDDAGTGTAQNGALIQINVNTNTVVNVIGTSATGIYTQGGLLSQDILAIAVDQSYYPVNRIWVLTRNGLAYGDMNTSTGNIPGWSTVSNAGAGSNVLASGSQRGLGGYLFHGTQAIQNGHPGLLDVDTIGNVYWISAPSGGGIHRLNKLTRSASTHTFFSLDSTAEGSALGYINIGDIVGTSGIRNEVCALRLQRRDGGDPNAESIWLSSGYGSTSSTNLVFQIPTTSFTTGNNPGTTYAGSQFSTSSTHEAFQLHLAPDGTVWTISSNNATTGLLESLGRVNSGANFDSSNGSGVGTWTNTNQLRCPANWFIDASGVAFIFCARSSGSIGTHLLNFYTPITYQWSSGSSAWYRSICATVGSANAATASTSTRFLSNNIQIAFANGAGPLQFVTGEYYTFGASIGCIKDPTQQITFTYDFYNEATTYDTDEAATARVAQVQTAAGGIISCGALTTVTTDAMGFPAASPTGGTQAAQLGCYQRSLLLDGTNNTVNCNLVGSGTIDTTHGFQIGVDFGSAVVASLVRFAFEGFSATAWAAIQIDLYSSPDNSSSAPTWTLRGSYTALSDNPYWNIQTDAFHNSATGSVYSSSGTSGVNEVEVDLNSLLGGGNTSQRYWKIAVHMTSGSASVSAFHAVGATGFDGSGLPIGIPSALYLTASNDSNYLANMIIRGTWLEAGGTVGGSTGASGSGTTTVTTTGSFSGAAANDYFRILTGPYAGTEIQIASVTDSTHIVLVSVSPFFGPEDWTIRRNASFRPIDNQGGGENQARFPTATGEVFLCPVSGHMAFASGDITSSNTLYIDKFVKVKRSA